MCVEGRVAVEALSSDFVARRKTTIATFHGGVFYVLHMEFDVKDKKLLSNQSDGTTHSKRSNFTYARVKLRIQSSFKQGP